MKRKGLSVLLAGAFVAMMLGGCGKSENKDKGKEAAGTTGAISGVQGNDDIGGYVSGGSDDTGSDGSDLKKDTDNTGVDGVMAEGYKLPELELKDLGNYKNTQESSNGRLRVETDSSIRMPDVDKFPVVRVLTEQVDDDFLEKVKELLAGDTLLYDGIRMYDPIYDEYSGDKVEIDPADKDQIEGRVPRSGITGYPVETKLFGISDKAESYKDVPGYAGYYMSLMPEGSLYYGVSDGADGNYISLSAANTEVYGSSLKFFKSREYGIKDGLVMPGINTDYCWPVSQGIDYIWKGDEESRLLYQPMVVTSYDTVVVDGEEMKDNYKLDPDKSFKDYIFRESERETNSVSQADAVKQADDLLEKLGISDAYAATNIEERYISDASTMRRKDNSDGTYCTELTVGKVWYIVYQPAVKGIAVEDFGEMVKYDSAGRKESVWFNPWIEVMINDNGIVGFSYNGPVKYEEVTNEAAPLMDIQDIKAIYEKNVIDALNKVDPFYGIADSEEGDEKYTISINEIRLTYARVSDHESNERGFLVPLWDFTGTATDFEGNTIASGSFLQINAIDGSVYNAMEGK